MIVDAEFVSVWDGDVEIRTDCKIDLDTGHVFDIQVAESDHVESLDSEYVEWPGHLSNVESNEQNEYYLTEEGS